MLFIIISVFIILPTCAIIMLLGKSFLYLNKKIKKFDNDAAFINTLEINNEILNGDEYLMDFSSKPLEKKHVTSSCDDDKLKNYIKGYKIGQIISLCYYYQNNRLDEHFDQLKKLAQLLLFISFIVAGDLANEFLKANDFTIFLGAVTSTVTKVISIAQIATFIMLLTKINAEVIRIQELLKPKY